MEMAPATISANPRTVEEIFKDFSARRAGLVRALTSEVEDFYGYCDPDKENLCLYGLPNGTWEVAPPAEEVPPEIPEPALGINFARDGMQRRDWLSLVAVHSDSWLLSVAFFFGARLNANDRVQNRMGNKRSSLTKLKRDMLKRSSDSLLVCLIALCLLGINVSLLTSWETVQSSGTNFQYPHSFHLGF